jgi:hypothetical protein
MRREKSLKPLLDRYTPQAVWNAAEVVLGCPPTWQLNMGELLRVQERLEVGS